MMSMIDVAVPVGEELDRLAAEAAMEAWPEPDPSVLDNARASPPELPIDVFGPCAEWIRAEAEIANAPPDYVAAALLAVAGSLVANTRRAAPWPGWSEPPILWVANVGLPSSNKSPALDRVIGPLREIERELGDVWAERHAAWEVEATQARIRRKQWEAEVAAAEREGTEAPPMPEGAREPAEPTLPRLFLQDATMEAAARVAAENPRGLLVVRDELAGFLASFGRYARGGAEDMERSFWLEGYGGRFYTIDRNKLGSRPLRIDRLAIAVVGNIQPDRLERAIAGDNDGLQARFLYIWPDPVPLRRPRAQPCSERLERLMRALHGLEPEQGADGRPRPSILPFTEPAAQELQAFRERNAERERTACGPFQSWIGKMPGVVVRIALVLSLLDWAAAGGEDEPPHEIGVAYVRRAMQLVDAYLVRMAARVFTVGETERIERDAAKIARHILEGRPLPEVVNARVLRRQRVLGTQKAHPYDRALGELEEAGWLRRVPRSGGPGRRPKTYEVNPRLAQRPAITPGTTGPTGTRSP